MISVLLIAAIILSAVWLSGRKEKHEPMGLSYDTAELRNNTEMTGNTETQEKVFSPRKIYVPSSGDVVKTYVRYASIDDGKLTVDWGAVNLSDYDRTIFNVRNIVLYYYDADKNPVVVAKSGRTFTAGLSTPYILFKGQDLDVASPLVFEPNEYDHTIDLSQIRNLHMIATWGTEADAFPDFKFTELKSKDVYSDEEYLPSFRDEYTEITIYKITFDESGMHVTLRVTNESDESFKWKRLQMVYLLCNNYDQVLAKATNVKLDSKLKVGPRETKMCSFTLRSGTFDPNVQVGTQEYVRFDGAFS